MPCPVMSRTSLVLAIVICAACSRGAPRGPRAASATADTACPEGMVLIPGGTFMMGARPEDAFLADEAPPHRVTLSPYCIDRTEVTAEAYARCDAPGCRAPTAEVGPHCANTARHPRYPRNCINWHHAVAYCAFRGARLPTEAEWEFAARGPSSFMYPWGNTPPDASRAQYGAVPNRYPGSAPVGTHPAGRSPFGLDDMTGNVSEWVADWYGPYTAAPQTNPRGPDEGDARVVKGRAFDVPTWDRALVTTSRMLSRPDEDSYTTGFRCAAEPE